MAVLTVNPVTAQDGQVLIQENTFGAGDVSVSPDSAATTFQVGVSASKVYNEAMGYLGFDTSTLTAAATISSAILQITTSAAATGTVASGDIEVRFFDFGTAIDSSDRRTASQLAALTSFGTFGAITTAAAYTVDGTAAAASINKTGTTRFILNHKASRVGTWPGADSFITAYTTDNGSNKPQLSITYTVNTLPTVISTAPSYKTEVLADAPLGYWRLGEAVPGTGTAADSSGNGRNGSYVASPSSVAAQVNDADTAVSFNGSTQYVTVPHNAALNVGDSFTLEAWVKTSGTGRAIMAKGGSGGYYLQVQGGKVVLTKSGTADILTGATTITNNAWHHIVATKSGANAAIYVDGVLDASTSSSAITVVDTTDPLNIAVRSPVANAEYITGSLDEVAIYAGALSATRIKAHFDAATPTVESGVTPFTIKVTDPDSSQTILYGIEVATSSAFTTIVYSNNSSAASPLNAFAANFTPTGLTSATTYWWRGWADDQQGGGRQYSTARTFTTSNVIAKSATDSLNVGTSDASRAIAATVNTSDPINVGTADASRAIAVTVASSDGLSVGASDAVNSDQVTVQRPDDVTVGVNENSSVLVQMSAADALILGITDISQAPIIINYITASDTIGVSISDTVQGIFTTVASADGLAVGVDGTANVLASLNRVDDLGVGVVEANQLLVKFGGQDSLNVGISEGSAAPTYFIFGHDTLDLSLLEESHSYSTWYGGIPPDEIINSILGMNTRVTRRVELYESDGVTLYAANPYPAFTGGTVSVDQSRAERRTLQIELWDDDGTLKSYPEGFWYDKIIKVYRGARTNNTEWEVKLGEFLIDQINEGSFTGTVSVTARDYTKMIMGAKLPQPTNFPENYPIEEIVRTMALNSGITKLDLPLTGVNTDKAFLFDTDTTRWQAAFDVCTAYNYELFFDNEGYLVMREFTDPLTSDIAFTFQTGPAVGNLANYTKSTSDSRIRNHMVVTGQAPDGSPVWAEALNTNPDSPTRIDKIGTRTERYDSKFITSFTQAQEVADTMLKTLALESYDANLDAIVMPWLDVGVTVAFIDPNPAPDAPTRFLLSTLSIPLSLTTMPANIKRVTVVLP
jgi:hypothetical protein